MSSDTSSVSHDVIRPLIVIAIVVVFFFLVSEGFLRQFSALRLISSKGNIQVPADIGIYWSSDRTSPVYSIDWGSLRSGSTRSIMFYVVNEGNSKVFLTLSTSNWMPANISRYMNLTWNYDGQEIIPAQTVQVTLTLSTSSSEDFLDFLIMNDVKSFSFDVMLNAVT